MVLKAVNLLQRAGKALTTRANDAARYAKACGKSSILQTKPVKPLQINGISFAPEPIGDIATFSTRSFSSRIKELSTAGQESTTLKKLFSAEFKPTRRFDENGYMVTTLIDRKTQKPVEVFVKKIKEGKFEFYKKTTSGYDYIGKRDYSINRELGVIEPGFMANSCKEEFAGLGIRGHQLAVEDLMKEGLDSIYLSSLPKALPFHQKSLFKPLTKMKVKQSVLDDQISDLCETLSMSRGEIEKLFSYEKVGDIVILDTAKTTNKLNQLAKRLGQKDLIIDHPTMFQLSLEGEALALWKDMVRTQPIMI